MTGVSGRSAKSNRGSRDIEREFAVWFKDYLHLLGLHRYRIRRLDQRGQNAAPGRMPDFLLRGVNCSNVGLELKRLVRYARCVEEKTRLAVEKIVRKVRGNGELPRGYAIIFRSMPPDVPERRDQCSYARFIEELYRAFATAKTGHPYKSDKFELHRVVGQPFYICTITPHSEKDMKRELFRLLTEADRQLGSVLETREAEMRVILLVIAGEDLERELHYWLRQWQELESCPEGQGDLVLEWRPEHTTHIYSMSIGVKGNAPYLSVAGIWAKDPTKPCLNGEAFNLAPKKACRYSAYANGICEPK